jgi:hypothetical protein
MSCPFANILGQPKTGVHSIRLFGIAVVDSILTILVAFVTYKTFKVNFFVCLTGWFILGEVFHYIFGVRTAFLEKINMVRNCR